LVSKKFNLAILVRKNGKNSANSRKNVNNKKNPKILKETRLLAMN
jgi:hypothetical protein